MLNIITFVHYSGMDLYYKCKEILPEELVEDLWYTKDNKRWNRVIEILENNIKDYKYGNDMFFVTQKIKDGIEKDISIMILQG